MRLLPLLLMMLTGCSVIAPQPKPSGALVAACDGTLQPRDDLASALPTAPDSVRVPGINLISKLDAACAAIGAK